MEPDADTLGFCGPFPPADATFRPEWRTETVVGLANGIDADKAFERLPILADALEDEGCDSTVLLRHCREPVAHDDHCWALDLVLGREPDAEAVRLMTEIRRLTEQIAALEREVGIEHARMAENHQRLAAIERRIVWLRRRHRVRVWLRLLVCVLLGTAIGQLIAYLILE